jgi:uncharacterized protein (TIGR03083 family)
MEIPHIYGGRMDPRVQELRRSSDRLRDLVTPLDDAALDAQAYPTEWSIAQVLSHLGSGAVIIRRRLDDGLAGREVPDDFAPSVWDTWNAKSARAMCDDALIADAAVVERLEGLSDEDLAGFRFRLGPREFDGFGLVGLRLNEHTFHSWDIAVALDPSATLDPGATALVVDNLAFAARFSARPTGNDRTVTVRTVDPERSFTIGMSRDAVSFAPDGDRAPDLTLPAEAFARLVYGRLDPDHTPAFEGDPDLVAELRRVYQGF